MRTQSEINTVYVLPSESDLAPMTLPTREDNTVTGLAKAYMQSLSEIKKGNKQLENVRALKDSISAKKGE